MKIIFRITSTTNTPSIAFVHKLIVHVIYRRHCFPARHLLVHYLQHLSIDGTVSNHLKKYENFFNTNNTNLICKTYLYLFILQ